MKEAFLRSLAGYILRIPAEERDDLLVILPNRRAGVFLQHYLSEMTAATIWMPRFAGMADFVEEESELGLADPLEMVFLLYDIYCELHEAPTELDEFWPWGELMIRDFDELDKYLVDAGQLFRNIHDLKMLEEPLAGLDEQQLVFIRQFWENFHAGDDSPEKESFLQTWQLLPKLYTRLRERLALQKQGYQGMLYRELADRVLHKTYSPAPTRRLIIAGFNALNACEEMIFGALRDSGAAFFWDQDLSYMKDPQHEAGRFLRACVTNYPEKEKLQHCDSLKEEKDIRIFELPTDIMQAKTLNRLLREKAEDLDPVPASSPDGQPPAGGNASPLDTAVVLCDEDLLMPSLMSLPEDVGEVNITMGYPLNSTPAFSFLEALLRLQQNQRKTSSGKCRFYHRDVNEILQHPLYRGYRERKDEELEQRIVKENMIMVDQDLFGGEFDGSIFRAASDAAGLVEYLRRIFDHLLEQIVLKEDSREGVLEREFCFHLLKQLNKLAELIRNRRELPLALMERLLRRAMSVVRVPFEGEPLSGLQVMGILETRMLDFRHVIMLSLNEEVMPARASQQSYIPYTLRLAFSMPSREEKDAIYAYYFYRLLQRAEKVDLLFNGGTEGLSIGEISRYGQQLIYDRSLEVQRPGFRILTRELKPIEIAKDQASLDFLQKFIVDPEANTGSEQDERKAKYFSPSALNLYIKCPLAYYFRYVAGLGESREISEDMDVADLGTVVHDALSILYEEIAENNNRMIPVSALAEILKSKKHSTLLEELFIKQHYRGRKGEKLEGRNILVFRVMLHYLEQVIKLDIKLGDFELISTELEYKRSLEIAICPVNSKSPNSLTPKDKDSNKALAHVRLGGKIDRVDRVNGQVRVIDYKTGRNELNFPDMESLFDREKTARNAAAMQTMLYAWLLAPDQPGQLLSPGLYSMKGVFAARFDPVLQMGSRGKKERITDFSAHEEEFIKLLKDKLNELYDPGQPFVQRKNDQDCKYCDYAAICQRKPYD